MLSVSTEGKLDYWESPGEGGGGRFIWVCLLSSVCAARLVCVLRSVCLFLLDAF